MMHTDRQVNKESERRSQRLEAQRQRDRRRRQAESAEEADRRRTAHREAQRRYRQARAARETTEQMQVRKQNQRRRVTQARALESNEMRSLRLERERSRANQARARECVDSRQVRLNDMRSRMRNRPQAETDEERQARLADMRIRMTDRLLEQTDEERQARLADLSIRMRDRLEEETDEQRQARLADLSIRMRHRLEEETDEQRQARLADLRIRNQGRRQNEPQFHTTLHERSTQAFKTFHDTLANCAFQECPTCNESFPKLNPNLSLVQCTRCTNDKKQPKLYSHENNMDPGIVPPELKGLTQIEEMLISPVMPMMAVYRLPHGQYGYSGHVVNLPQNVSSFVSKLPRLANDLDILLVRRNGDNGSHRDFKVNRSKVLHALQWLQSHNKYFVNIEIDQSHLAQLPDDGYMNTLDSITLNEPTCSESSTSGIVENDPHDTFLSGTFVPMNFRKGTEREIVRSSLTERQQHPHINTQPIAWPEITNTPINEFRTEGYISCAFPTLFPTGAGDFNQPRLHTVTIGNYFKHLMMYKDGRFAKHPRFRFFALNTEMRWRALQAGRIYVRQHPQDAQLSVQELRDLVGSENEAFSNRVLHFATSLRGTRPYWFKQRSRLIAMVDTLGLPTVFFTHSAADTQWPELANLICAHNPSSKSERIQAVVSNPAIADWFFFQRIKLFLKHFYKDTLNAKDYWLRFEYQHRGSPHVHGLAWLENSPDIEALRHQGLDIETTQKIVQHANSVVSTTNPAVLPDGSNISEAPHAQVDPHICNKAYKDVVDFGEDLAQLVATCQRHTRCSSAYCLRENNGKQQCRFGYPKDIQLESSLELAEDGEIKLTTARNDPLINSYNPLQLSAWRANVDMQYCVSRRKVIEYCAKYATKTEPRSEPLKLVYKNIVQHLTDSDKSLKVVQKLLINSVGERDYSAQETCHLLLQLPLYIASRDFVILSVDGTRVVEDRLDQDKPATSLSILDHYKNRPRTLEFDNITLLDFAKAYTMPRVEGNEPSHRSREVVVIIKPNYSPQPDSPNYEDYCRQKLMLYKPFRNEANLLCEHRNFVEAYTSYLQSGNVPASLLDDIHSLQNHRTIESDTDDSDESTENELESRLQQNTRHVEEWMMICQHHLQVSEPSVDSSNEQVDWCHAARAYPNLAEMPSFITHHKQITPIQQNNTQTNPHLLQGKQLQAYSTIQQHFNNNVAEPLHMIISGTAGTGKSFLINCLKALLKDSVKVAAPTGVAAFNVQGCTLHSLLHLPTKGEFRELQGEQLQNLQETLTGIRYIIIDEMSMVGRKLFGQIDKRLRQAFPHTADKVLGNCSCMLFGDFGQLPPVMDLPLYSSDVRSALSDLGRTAYQSFTKAIVLTQVMRQAGQDSEQVRFREILLRLRDAQVTIDDWQHLMTRSLACIADREPYRDALHLFPTIDAVAKYNVTKLHQNNHPIAKINAVHKGPNANKASIDDAGGLEPIIHLAHGARVMLISNLWVEAGLVNGSMGTVQAICYPTGCPPSLPTAVMVQFDSYSGPTLPDGTVPIVPIRRTWSNCGKSCSRLQIPLKLAWAITIHKAQGLTLNKVVIDIGSKEFSTGLTFVACSRVRHLTDLIFEPPFDYNRLTSLSKSRRLHERQLEDQRLHSLSLCQS